MAKYKIVHYLNQFFGGIGGEDKADFQPEVREEIIGPGMALNAGLGDDYEIVATVICGDNYFGENLDKATDTIVEMVKKYEPDIFVAGPAFNAGRYGVACGTICKAVEERLGIPVLSGMYEENPGADMFKQDVILVKTGNSAATMKKAVPQFVTLIKKLATGEEILGPSIEGYLERGILAKQRLQSLHLVVLYQLVIRIISSPLMRRSLDGIQWKAWTECLKMTI